MRETTNIEHDRSQADLVLDAAHECIMKWGHAKVTVDDIVELSGVSRATIYRLFPGGRDVLFEALRVRELGVFFDEVRSAVSAAAGLEDVVVTAVVTATRLLRMDEGLIAMMATEPGELLDQLTMEGVPRIVGFARMALMPELAPYVVGDGADLMIDVLSRLTISYFLAPRPGLDLGDEPSARAFVRPFIDALIPSNLLHGADLLHDVDTSRDHPATPNAPTAPSVH